MKLIFNHIPISRYGRFKFRKKMAIASDAIEGRQKSY